MKLEDEVSADAVGFFRGGDLAVLCDGQVLSYSAPDFEKHRRLLTADRKIFDVSNSSLFTQALGPRDDRLLVGGDARSELWQRAEGTWRRTAPLPGCLSAEFHPAGSMLALTGAMNDDTLGAGSDGTVELWSTTGTPRRSGTLHGHMSLVMAMDFSADGRLLATASYDGTVRLWDLSKRI